MSALLIRTGSIVTAGGHDRATTTMESERTAHAGEGLAINLRHPLFTA